MKQSGKNWSVPLTVGTATNDIAPLQANVSGTANATGVTLVTSPSYVGILSISGIHGNTATVTIIQRDVAGNSTTITSQTMTKTN